MKHKRDQNVVLTHARLHLDEVTATIVRQRIIGVAFLDNPARFLPDVVIHSHALGPVGLTKSQWPFEIGNDKLAAGCQRANFNRFNSHVETARSAIVFGNNFLGHQNSSILTVESQFHHRVEFFLTFCARKEQQQTRWRIHEKLSMPTFSRINQNIFVNTGLGCLTHFLNSRLEYQAYADSE